MIETCKECNKQLDREQFYYDLNIGDETERKWNKEKFNLCSSCWGNKKENYKSLVGNYNKYKWEDKKIKVWKMIKNQAGGQMEEIGNCQTCKKWDDEYEVRNRHENYCSLNCEQNRDKGNNDDDNPEKERKRERESKITLLKSRIKELKAISNRTNEQETELKEKQAELAKLENQNTQEPKKTNYLPWIIGGMILVGIVGIIIYLFTRKKRENGSKE